MSYDSLWRTTHILESARGWSRELGKGAEKVVDYSSTDDGLRWWAIHDPEKRLIVCKGDAVTFREVDEWVDRVAHHLIDMGGRIGAPIGIIGNNSIEWCICAFAVLRIGAILAPLSERSVAHEASALVGVTDTRLVFVAESHRAMMDEVVSKRRATILAPLEGVLERRLGDVQPFEHPEVDNAKVATVIYSSGSTGMPKGVALTMSALLHLIQEWSLTDPAMGRDLRVLAPTSLAPMGGFVDKVLRPSVTGGTVFLQPKFDENEALELLVEERISSLLSVPLIFQRISALPAFADADLSALVNAGIGGAPVPVDEFQKWHVKGVSLRQIYGSTEAGSQFTAMTLEGAADHLDRVGRGNIFRRVKIVRPDGTKCEPDEDGEILVRGPSLMAGYWGDKEATEAVLKNGWLHTGDLGQMDREGYFKVTDRIKEVIISGGYNVGPTEVEHALLALDGIEEAAVVPVPDDAYGEAIGALVRVTGSLSTQEIIEHCRRLLAGYKVPRYLLTIDEPLPRGEQGKYAKMSMRKEFGDRLKASPVR